MRRVSQTTCAVALARFHGAAPAAAGGKKYDLFGYEVDTNTAPWIEKINACKFYDDAGEVLVDMNVKNCPPDLATYNATLQRIFEAPSKQSTPVENESKFCAMMDLLEEMSHRNKIKPDAQSWTWVMKECVKSSNFRVGFCIQRVMEAEVKGCPADLVAANQANADKAKSEGKEHPGHLAKQLGLFDIQIQ
mmetsp:Transcript_10229/g.19990  ORF Transcript_10229/g.19990 Transcript_10229/m.19990 type:complete len:191 (-) Transcript_10229:97-669(-)